PISSWSVRKDSNSGVVRTPPKSEMTASISAIAADLVVAEPLAALDRPAEEGDHRVEPVALDRYRADQRAAAAHRPAVLAAGPDLERGAALDPVLAVLGREQRLLELDRRRVGVAEDGGGVLVAVAVAAGWEGRGQREQAAVAEDDPDRAPPDLPLLAH